MQCIAVYLSYTDYTYIKLFTQMRNRKTFHRNQNVLQNIYNIVKFIKKKLK